MFAIKNRTFAINNRGNSPGRYCHHALTGVITLAIVVSSWVEPVAAQQYKEIPPKMSAKAARSLKSKVSPVMRSSSAFQAGGKELLDRYFKTDYFYRMTLTSPEALASLGKKREALIKLLRGSSAPAAQAYLTNATLETMPKIARNNFHPAVRYNATLLLGMLDQKYAVTGGANPTPPVVLPAATAQLLELLEQNEFKGVKVHPSVKAGALEGLQRHVRFGIDPQYAERVTQAAMAVLNQDPSTLEVNQDVNNWMKCQAAGVLAVQFKAGPSRELHDALTKLIASDTMGVEDRCCIVGLLGKMTYTPAADVDATSTVLPLGKLTKSVVAAAAKKAKDFEKLAVDQQPATGFGRGGRRGGNEGPKMNRSEMLGRFSLIEQGAKSLIAGLPEEQSQKVQSLLDLLAPVVKIAQSNREIDLDVAGDVINLKSKVNSMVASWQPVPAAADAVVDPGFVEPE